MSDHDLSIEGLEIEPLSDECLEFVAGGKDRNSDGLDCCSIRYCSNDGSPGPTVPEGPVIVDG